ncbi:MAG: EH signature domain-containing protein [Desulfomonilia bacterium]|jgi:hypothetical protein
MHVLDSLRLRINQTFSAALHDAAWGRPQLMSKALEEVCSAFDTPADTISQRSIEKTLLTFRRSSELPAFLDLKYACLGISHIIEDDGWRLIEDNELFPLLMRKVDAEKLKFHQFLKCYQGLLSGYFDYNIFADDVAEAGQKNWESLRRFLLDHLHLIQRAMPAHRWVHVISEHMNLLSENLCDRYGLALAQGDCNELKSALEGLFIPRNSWVWEATVLARINAVCSFGDDEFKGHLERCLAMITHNSGIMPSEILKKKCIARIVSRYAQCVSRPEHTSLRDSAVTIIGNPWINRAAWDAFVNDETARELINGWFKRRLITEFFRVLSEDPSADKKRLQYWLRFVPKIEDMWFALGPHAFTHPGADFKDFRKLAQDRILALENGDKPQTNALIMRIDEYVFVEFGTTRNSCLVFKSNNLPFDLDNKWIYIGSRPSEQPYKLLLKHALRQDIIDTTREAKPSSKLSPKLRKHAIPS